MKNVIFDLFTGHVKGYDREPLAAEDIIEIPYPIKLSKTVEEKTGNMIQKVNNQEESLYKDEVVINEITGEESYTEVTTPIKVTAYETATNTYKIVVGEEMVEQINEFSEPVLVPVPIYDEITNTSEVPVEWIELEPIMVEEIIFRTYTLEQNPFLFTKDEVIEAVNKSIVDNTNLPPTEVEVLQECSSLLSDNFAQFMDYYFTVNPE